jgi:uncharacterized OB-fold protein
MTTEYRKPLPLRSEENAPYLDGLKRRALLLQRCGVCSKYRYPPSMHCPSCLSDESASVESSGRGFVYSFIILHQPYHPGFREDLPYNVAVVELEEGPRVVTNITGCANEGVRIGMPVTADYFDATPDCTILKFRPA